MLHSENIFKIELIFTILYNKFKVLHFYFNNVKFKAQKYGSTLHHYTLYIYPVEFHLIWEQEIVKFVFNKHCFILQS